MTVQEKLDKIVKPCSVGQSFHTTFSVAVDGLMELEKELKKYNTSIVNAEKENNGTWLISIEKVA